MLTRSLALSASAHTTWLSRAHGRSPSRCAGGDSGVEAEATHRMARKNCETMTTKARDRCMAAADAELEFSAAQPQ
jgi:hypothetical protein